MAFEEKVQEILSQRGLCTLAKRFFENETTKNYAKYLQHEQTFNLQMELPTKQNKNIQFIQP